MTEGSDAGLGVQLGGTACRQHQKTRCRDSCLFYASYSPELFLGFHFNFLWHLPAIPALWKAKEGESQVQILLGNLARGCCNIKNKPDVVVHARNPCTREAEAGGSL